jgi:hypothetical protein
LDLETQFIPSLQTITGGSLTGSWYTAVPDSGRVQLDHDFDLVNNRLSVSTEVQGKSDTVTSFEYDRLYRMVDILQAVTGECFRG